VDIRRSEPTLPSVVRRIRPEAVTPVELIWRVPPPPPPLPLPLPLPPPLPVARAGVMSTPLAMPSMHDLATIARNLAAESSLLAAVVRLQRDVGRLLRVTDTLCVWLDWPRRIAWTLSGRLGVQVHELVMQVAGSGHRTIVGSALVEPIGPAPTRSVLALRKPPGMTFGRDELAMIGALAAGIAPALDRLIANQPR